MWRERRMQSTLMNAASPERKQGRGRGGKPKATRPLGYLHACCPCQHAELNAEGAQAGSVSAMVCSPSGHSKPGGDKTAATWQASTETSKLELAHQGQQTRDGTRPISIQAPACVSSCFHGHPLWSSCSFAPRWLSL